MITKFDDFVALIEDGNASCAVSLAGMGPITSPQPSPYAGDTSMGTIGSGDVPVGLYYNNLAARYGSQGTDKKRKKRKKQKRKAD